MEGMMRMKIASGLTVLPSLKVTKEPGHRANLPGEQLRNIHHTDRVSVSTGTNRHTILGFINQ